MNVTVLGGGVSGVSTGLLLAALGYRPTIVTRRRADHAQGDHAPLFASLYPAASVIPHAVRVDDVAAHTEETQTLFEVFRQHGTCGVRSQMHYEVFETPTDLPDYAPALHDLRRLPDDGSGEPGAPRRPDAEDVYGWYFRTYFVETPTYVERLYELFEVAGGRVEERSISRGDLEAGSDAFSSDVLVNCLGAGAVDLFDDPRPLSYLRGCLVYAAAPRPALHREGREVCSYNYEPAASHYRRADGSPEGLYAYPRSDVWILGGTKRAGRLGPDGEWTGDPVVGETVAIDGVDVPRPVVETNAALLDDLFGVDVHEVPLRAAYGIRFARDLDGDGVRLETGDAGGRLVVHNYGHGGAGVTLSWSCALRVARMLRAEGVSPSPERPPVSGRDGILLRRLAETARHLGL